MFANQTCTIRPRWLNVNVTYNSNGFVTVEPIPQKLPDIPINSSMIILSGISTLDNNFVNSQSMVENHIIDSIGALATLLDQDTDNTSDPQFEEIVRKKTVSTTTNTLQGPSHTRWTILLARLTTFEACSNTERQCAPFLQHSISCYWLSDSTLAWVCCSKVPLSVRIQVVPRHNHSRTQHTSMSLSGAKFLGSESSSRFPLWQLWLRLLLSF